LHGAYSCIVADLPIRGGELLVRVRDVAVLLEFQEFESPAGGKPWHE
jgi:hypothetical protein